MFTTKARRHEGLAPCLRAFLVIFLALVLPACRAIEAPPRVEHAAPRCVVCGEPMTTAGVELDGRVYHVACYERAGPHCGICGALIRGSYVTVGEGFDYHQRCWDSSPRCEGCGLPAAGSRGPASRWGDGRVTCATCRKEAVTDGAAAREVLDEARATLRDALGLDVGAIRIPIQLVSKPELIAAAEELGQSAIKALTVVREEAPSNGRRGPRSYRMLALYGLPRPALVGILGHELFHVLQCEATGDERDAAFREGSANYVQVALLRARHEDARARLLERDTDPIYGEGLRRFEQLVKARGEKQALRFGLASLAFPPGY